MLDHVGIQVADVAASAAFYEAVLAPLGYSKQMDFGQAIGFGTPESPSFWISLKTTETLVHESHIAFAAADRDRVVAFFDAAVAAGAEVLHEPRVWPEYHASYFGAFVRDPDGNNIEAVCHAPEQPVAVHIHHEEFGAGHPIVLVHGWGVGAKRNWIDTGWVAALEAIRRVVVLDVRGHGRSDKPLTQASYGYRAMSEDVLQVMDELGIDKADLFGYSMGAFMAVSLLGSHHDRFTSVVMGGIGDETEQSEAARSVIADALRADEPGQITDPIGRAYRAFVDADPTSDREALALAALQMWPEGHPLELGGAGLRAARIPVLIVNGADDHPYVGTVHRLGAELPHVEVVTIPDADHVSVVTDPRFRTTVLDFLARHDSARAH